jgi:hypothetical protein
MRQYRSRNKKNSKGYLGTRVGYKLHPDVADGQIPVSSILTSASLHDSQAAIVVAVRPRRPLRRGQFRGVSGLSRH